MAAGKPYMRTCAPSAHRHARVLPLCIRRPAHIARASGAWPALRVACASGTRPASRVHQVPGPPCALCVHQAPGPRHASRVHQAPGPHCKCIRRLARVARRVCIRRPAHVVCASGARPAWHVPRRCDERDLRADGEVSDGCKRLLDMDMARHTFRQRSTAPTCPRDESAPSGLSSSQLQRAAAAAWS